MNDERDWQSEDELDPDWQDTFDPPDEYAEDEAIPEADIDDAYALDETADESAFAETGDTASGASGDWAEAEAEDAYPPEGDMALEAAALAAQYPADEVPAEPDSPPADPAELGEGERLRQPRAQSFRRRLANQIAMLPLALYLLVMGGYLIADKQDVGGLPDVSSLALSGGLILAVAASMMLHSIVLGRRERGLLFVGLWIWITAGAIILLAFSFKDDPAPGDWWPILLATLGAALLMTYLVERAHDTRLVLLSMLILVASGVAFWTTLGDADLDAWQDAVDYWPLLLAALGVMLLPLAFRRRVD